jgi:hypothetical protein
MLKQDHQQAALLQVQSLAPSWVLWLDLPQLLSSCSSFFDGASCNGANLHNGSIKWQMTWQSLAH